MKRQPIENRSSMNYKASNQTKDKPSPKVIRGNDLRTGSSSK